MHPFAVERLKTMKLKQCCVCVLCFVLLLLTTAGIVTAATAAPDTAVLNAVVLEDLPIYVPSAATDVENSAAKELQNYLEKITGKKPSVWKEFSGSSSGIYIGATKAAADSNVTFTDNNGRGEGWAIKVIGKKVIVTGGETRGALYGVYHLLEDVLGVRWWNMWEEYVPTMEDAVIPANYESSGEPAFGYRDIYIGAEKAETLFFARNRLNGWVSNAPQSYGGELNYTLPYHTHTFGRYFHPDAYFADHPEWYSWSEEKQARIPDGQLCLTNDGLIAAFKEKFLRYIQYSYDQADQQKIARPIFADITPNDTQGFCECPTCLAERAIGGLSGYYLKFVNKIAAEVDKQFPEIRVVASAYSAYKEVPLDGTKPISNVVIQLAHSDMDVIRDLNHPSNQEARSRTDDWAALLAPGQLLIWDYIVMYDHIYGVVPSYFRYQNDYRLYHEKGAIGIFSEAEMMNSADMWDMNIWILSKLQEDPYQDIHALVWSFVTGYYGEAAADDLYAYLCFMDESVQGFDTSIYKFGDKAIDAPWLTATDVLKADAYFESAIDAINADSSITAEEKSLYLGRLGVARRGLDEVILANYEKYAAEMTGNGESFSINKRTVGRRLIEALNWLDDMTAVEDMSGVQNVLPRSEYSGGVPYLLSRYARFIGEVDANGDMWWPELPQAVVDDYPNLDHRHVYDYPASTFFFDSNYVTRVENAASYEGGSALLLDQKAMFAYNANNQGNVPNDRFVFSETKALHCNLDRKLTLGDPLVADGEYHLYRIEDIAVFAPGKVQMSFFGVVDISMEGLQQLYGDKKVDVYLSLKIEGDPTGEDPENYAKIYFDRMLIVEDCSFYDIEPQTVTPATCAKGTVVTGICPICGHMASVEDKETRLLHSITGDYTYHADTNTYTAPCSGCGIATFSFAGQLPNDLLKQLKEDAVGLEHVLEYTPYEFNLAGIAKLEDDSESLLNKAIVLRSADSSNPILFIMEPGETWPIGATGNGNLGEMTYTMVEPNQNKGYCVYKIEGAKLPNHRFDYLHMFNWFVQNTIAVRELEYLFGQTVDIYVSLKVTGDIDNSVDRDLFPVNYLDRLFVVEPCGGCGAGRTEGHNVVRFHSEDVFLPEICVLDGQLAAEPFMSVNDDVIFDGWYLNGVKYDFSTPVTTDLDLFAKYTKKIPETEVEYGFTTVMNAFLSLESIVELNVTFEMTADAVKLTPEQTADVMDKTGLLVWKNAVTLEEATMENSEIVLTGTTYNASKDRMEIKTDGIPAKELGDALYFRPYYEKADGTYIYGRLIENYSPKKYCYGQIKANGTDKAVNIALLNYGAAAQVQFNYNTDDLMNAGLTEEQKALNWDGSLVRSDWKVPADKEGELGKDAQITSRNGYLSLDGTIDVNFAFAASVSAAAAEILLWDEAAYNAADVLTEANASQIKNMIWMEGKGRYEYKYEGIAAREMFSPIYACAKITDADGNVYYSGVVAYCAERAAYLDQNNSNTDLATLYKRIAIYGDAARTYFG